MPRASLFDDLTDDQIVDLIRRNGASAGRAAKALGHPASTVKDAIHRRGLAEEILKLRSPARAVEVDDILDAIRRTGTFRGAAGEVGLSYTSLHSRLERAGRLDEAVSLSRERQSKARAMEEPTGIVYDEDGDTVTLTEPPTRRPLLGDIGSLIRERGLDPDEWVVASVTLNEWDAMAAVKRGDEPRTVRMRQWKVTLRRAPHLLLALPASHVPRVRPKPGPPASDRPDLIVVEGDHQVPYHDHALHSASLSMLRHLAAKHRLAEHVFLGDTADFPTISRHADHPATADDDVNTSIQQTYELLRDKREAAPGARARKLKGNHDWRVESELLLRAERMYGIKPARLVDGPEEIPALSLRRLLHLDAIGVELVENRLGWEHGEVELIPGVGGLVVRHGWLTGANSALRSMEKRGRSLIVGHTHRREHVFKWDASAGLERQAVTSGTMSLVRSDRYPHYTTLDNWLQGFVVVTRWPDGRFLIDHALWNGNVLTWRDQTFTASEREVVAA